MKKTFLICTILLLNYVFANISSERFEIQEKILDSYMNQPVKELFKVYHFIFNKGYSLNSEEAIRRYKIFKKHLEFVKEHNNRKLTWTLGLNDFSDMTDEEYKAFNSLKAPNEMISQKKVHEKFLGEINKRELGYFDDMINQIDNESPKKDDDDDKPFPKLDNVNHLKYLSPVKNQASCGSCWAFSTVLSIEAAYNIKYNSNSTTLSQSVSPQQLVDCDKSSSGCNGGWMPYAYSYISSTTSKIITWEKNYPYTAKTGLSCLTANITDGIKVDGHEGCAPYGWFGYKTCTKDVFYGLLSKSPLGVVIDTNHSGFRFYRRGIIDLFAYENTTTPYKCDTLTHAVVAYAWTNQTVPDAGVREFISIRNSWANTWGDQGDFHIYYTPLYNNSCWVTNIASRPLIG